MGRKINEKSTQNSLPSWNASIWIRFAGKPNSRRPQDSPRRQQNGPRGPQDEPRRAQDVPKTPRDAPKMPTRRPQNGPRGPRDAQRRVRESPRMLQVLARRFKTLPNPPRSPPDLDFGVSGLRVLGFRDLDFDAPGP